MLFLVQYLKIKNHVIIPFVKKCVNPPVDTHYVIRKYENAHGIYAIDKHEN